MDKKVALDILISSFVLIVIIGARFNLWTQDRKGIFSGKPSDYIDRFRYLFYYGIYVLTFVVTVAIVYNFPEIFGLLSQDAATSEWRDALAAVFGKQSITVYSLLLVTILSDNRVSKYDELWRSRLHEWARIPRALLDVKNSIIREDSYSPGKKYLNRAMKELQIDADNSSRKEALRDYWVELIEHWQEQKEKRSINWSYIKCLCLLHVVRDTCSKIPNQDLQLRESRLRDLGKIIPFLDTNDGDISEHKQELDSLSEYFIECICKHLIKKYPSNQSQYNAFKNLGFSISFHDATDMRIGEAVGFCLVGVFLISAFSVGALLILIDHFELDTLVRWSLGSFICFCISIFVGIVVQKIFAARQLEPGFPVYVATLLVATLGAFIYFQIVSDATSNSLHFGRIMLALSFSTLSVVVIRALNDINYEYRDVVFASVVQAGILAIIMAGLQIMVSLSFTWNFIHLEDSTVLSLFQANDWRLAKVGVVGFFKGFFLGGIVCYLIQDMQRRQQLAALRNNPRVKFNKIMMLKTEQSKFRINTRNLSKNGAMIKSRKALKSGDTVVIMSPKLGGISGIIRWTRKGFMGKQLAGVEFTADSSELNTFLRGQFGEFYA